MGDVLRFAAAWAKRHPGEPPYTGPQAAPLAVHSIELYWQKSRVIAVYTLTDGTRLQAVMTPTQAKAIAGLLEERANAASNGVT